MAEISGDEEKHEIIFLEEENNKFNFGRDLRPDHPSRKSNASVGSGEYSLDPDSGKVI